MSIFNVIGKGLTAAGAGFLLVDTIIMATKER